MPARLARLTTTFSLVDGTERAMTSLWFLSATGETIDDFALVLQPLLDDLWTATRSVFSTRTAVMGHQLAAVDINTGHQINAVALSAPSSPAGTGSATTMPPEVAEVLTLRTPFTSARQRGRIYLPCVSVASMGALGDIVTSTKLTLVDGYAAFFDAVFADASDWVPGVYSRTDRSFTTLSAIDMGGIFDVVRSRRRSLVEQRYRVSVS